MGWWSDVQQAHGVSLREAYPSYADPDLAYLGRDGGGNTARSYRAISGGRADRDLSPLDQDRHIELACYLAEMNPLGIALIKLLLSFIVGEGFQLKATHPDVQAVLDDFWHDPTNAWPLKQFQRFRQLSIFGELICPAFVRRTDGHVKLGYIDPANVKAVSTNPMNAEEREWVYLKSKLGYEPPPLRIIHVDESPLSKTQGFLIGAERRGDHEAVGTFYCAVNHLSNVARGRSDLLALFDWLDLYDQFLFGSAERGLHQGDHVWDVTLDGMDETAQKEWVRKNRQPQGSTMRVHNEKVHWNVIAPKLEAHDTSEQARTIRMQPAVAHLLPEGWLFAGSETNRSTLGEQSIPTLKYLSQRQMEAKAIMAMFGRFAVDQAILAGKRLTSALSEDERHVEVEASEVSTKDLATVATTMKETTAHLVVGQDRQWITPEEAARVYRRGLMEYGAELDPNPPTPARLPDGAPVPNDARELVAPQQIREALLAVDIGRRAREMFAKLTDEERALVMAMGGQNGHVS